MWLRRALLAFLLSPTAVARPSGEVEWLADAGQAFARAAESGRPLLVVFR
jgi:hypothetical protein